MPHEHPTNFYENPSYRTTTEGIKAISSFAIRLTERSELLKKMYEEGGFTVSEYASRNARITYLETIARATILIAKNEMVIAKPFYLLDDEHKEILIDDFDTSYPEVFHLHTETIHRATKTGMKAAKGDLFRMITPNSAQDKLNHFVPWRRDLAEYARPNGVRNLKDGRREVIIPTSLPNIGVVHTYPQGKRTMPVEEIRFLGESNLIPPSSQQ